MASHHGRNAAVHADGNAVINVYNWTMNRTATPIIQSIFGDTWVNTHGLGVNDWNGSFEAIGDKTDTNGQVVLDDAFEGGTTVSGRFYLDNTNYYYGTLYITEASDSTDPEDVARTTYSFQGSSTLSKSWS